MKKYLFLAICVGYGLLASSQKIADSITLKNLEIDWHHAYTYHNKELIKNVLSEDFIDVGRTGNRINKQQVLENFSKDSSVYEYCEPFDLEFKIYKNSAIVLGRSKEKGTLKGKPFENIYFWHDVFVKQQSGWKCVLASVSLISQKK